MNPDIEINIEELVLHGFGRRDRFRIAQAVEQALAQMIAERGATPLLLQGGNIDRQESTFPSNPADKPHATGTHIARSVYGVLGGGGESEK